MGHHRTDFQSASRYERIGRQPQIPFKVTLMPEPTTHTLSLDTAHSGTTAVVRCNGRLIAGVDEQLFNHVSKLTHEKKRIVLDLTILARVDSMGLGTLVRIYVHCKSANCELQLVN